MSNVLSFNKIQSSQKPSPLPWDPTGRKRERKRGERREEEGGAARHSEGKNAQRRNPHVTTLSRGGERSHLGRGTTLDAMTIWAYTRRFTQCWLAAMKTTLHVSI